MLNFNFRQLENLNSRLSHDISSIFTILTDATYQTPSLLSRNAHILGNEEVKTTLNVEPVETAEGSDIMTSVPCSGTVMPTKELLISKSPSILPTKPRSTSAINISCQTPQSINYKRALSSSGGHRDFLPCSQVLYETNTGVDVFYSIYLFMYFYSILNLYEIQ